MNFIISILFSLIVVHVLAAIPLIGVWAFDLKILFGVVIPYAALAVFVVGIIYRVIDWGRSPVPFKIPTTAGQQTTLPWIKADKVDNPQTTFGVVIRMIFEILTFRSLFRNTKMQFREGPKIGYEWEKWLWLFALLFHYAFLTVVLRHLRFFTEPIPQWVNMLESLDGFMQVGILPFSGFQLPTLLLSGVALLGGATLLLLRRLLLPQMRYISLASDYFPLFLIIGIAFTGVLMRYLLKVDIIRVKELSVGLATFQPTVPDGIGVLFYMHLFLVSVLIAYFPFSKLMHLGGIFLSPTRNLSNNNRAVRYINPWNYPVKTHSYDAYEDEFREKMIEAGLPVEKMPEPEQPAEESAGEATDESQKE
jgi:nitrate reductase gamma subunit